MDEVLIDYFTAIEACSKGYPQTSCIKQYKKGGRLISNSADLECLAAPTQSQVQRWLRMHHATNIWIKKTKRGFLGFVEKYSQNTQTHKFYPTYEAALEGCLWIGLGMLPVYEPINKKPTCDYRSNL